MSLEHRLHTRCACESGMSSYGRAAARPFALAGVKRVYERPRPFVIRHIALEMDLLFEEKAIASAATIDFSRVDPAADELVLDAMGFEIELVEIRRASGEGGFEKAAHVYDGERLSVTVPRELESGSVRVLYRAAPRRGMYFLAPDEHVKDRPRQVWTQCQDEDARFIFPCHDKPHIKQTTEIRVKVPEGFYALSNGELVKEEGSVFHWKMSEPHPSYLFTLVAGEFSRLEAEVDGIPLSYLVPKGREADGERTFKRTPEMVRHFGELLGIKYPWNKYAQVVVSDFIFGGMENTTATTMYEHILLDERASLDVSSDDLIAHELAHHWFGDLVTCRDWSQGWLNEGFATFMEHIDREAHLGRDEYDYSIRGDMHSYIGEAHGRYIRPIVCQDYEEPIDIFDRHLYEKGGVVLHMLRRTLGDALFWRGVNLYLTRHQKGVVETRDLMRALEEVSGRSLDRFFEQWVHRPGHPELEIKIEHDKDLCTISVKQTQATGAHNGAPSGQSDTNVPLFAFDLDFDFGFEDGRVVRETRRVELASHTFVFRVPSRPRYVVVDPELAVLSEVKLDAPGDMLRAQLTEAKSARGRMLAAEALASFDDLPSTKALAASLAREEEFWGVRAEAAAALGKLRSDEAYAALAEAADKAQHPKARRGVIRALGHFRMPKAAELLRRFALRDPSYLVEAEAARALGATRQATAFDTLVDVLDRPSWADVIRAGALDGLANLRDDRASPHVIARTRYGVPTRARRAAILALPKLASDRKAREALEELLDGTDPYLRVDVVRALVDLGDSKARSALRRQLDRELDGRVRRRIREALRDLGQAGKREADKLRDELEALRGEHAELKARLSKVEAAIGPQIGESKGEGDKKKDEGHKAEKKGGGGKSERGRKR